MAKSNTFDDLILIGSRTPWWVGILLALVVYGGIVYLLPLALSDQFATMLGPALKVVAYLFSGVILVGVLIGLFQRRARRSLFERQTSLASIRDLSWQEFEQLIVEAFQREGYTAGSTPAGPDGGVDVVLTRNGREYLVQCKQWQRVKVGVKVARELAGVVATSGATGGILVCSGHYTRQAQEFAETANIELIDGPKLAQMLKLDTERPQAPRGPATDECPRCHSNLVIRTVKKGANRGRNFLGCSSFPACRYTRDA